MEAFQKNGLQSAFCVCPFLQLFHYPEGNQPFQMVGDIVLYPNCRSDYDDGFPHLFNETFRQKIIDSNFVDHFPPLYLYGGSKLFQRYRS